MKEILEAIITQHNDAYNMLQSLKPIKENTMATKKNDLVEVLPIPSKDQCCATCTGFVKPGNETGVKFDATEFCRLARIKEEIKALEKEAKEIQESLLKNYPEIERVEIPYLGGTMSKSSRDTWELINAKKLLARIGEKVFMSIVKVGKTDCAKAIGDVGFQKLAKEGVFELASTSISLTWRSK